MKFDFNTIATGIFGAFVTVGSLSLLLAKHKKNLAALFRKDRNKGELVNHFIFFEIQSWRDYQIDYKCNNVQCSVRSAIARKFLHLRFELKEEYYKTLIDHIKKHRLTFQYIAAQKGLMEDEFEEQAEEIGIPKIVVQKFKHHISQSEIADLYLYERILQYKNFHSDEDKLAAIFCVDLKDMYIAGKDIESVIMGLNGEIDKALGLQKRRDEDREAV
jgi:hypothetical protein